MIKFFNNSKLSSKILLKIIKKSMRELNLDYRKRNIIILITKGWRGGGYYSDGHLIKDSRFGTNQYISSDYGMIEVNPYLPKGDCTDVMLYARYMYNTINHELKHSFDSNVAKMRFDDPKKVPYRKRVQEVSAYWYAKYEAKPDERFLLDLAIDIQRVVKERK